MKINYKSLGACHEVTGSKHFLKVDDKTLMIDCGMFQGRRDESYEKNHDLLFDPSKVDAVMLTHAHFDHSGALPVLNINGFDGNIYSTSATRDIANIILLDSAYIQQKDAEYIKKKALKHPERNLEVREPLYDSDDAIKTISNFVTINYHRPFYPIPGVTAEFYDAGHILGSSMIYVNIDDKVKIGFSGDLGRRKLPIIKDPEIMPDLDYLVLEGTYGNRLHKSFGMAKDDMAETINKTYKRNGKVIIPAFTIERTQEIIYIIHSLILEKKIPEIQIFVDSPMAINATSVFKLHPECFDKATYDEFISKNINPFGFDNIKYTSSVKESMDINNYKKPAIILSASGMAENGRILHHLKNNVENPNNTIAIVGYMAAHTLGRKIVDREKEIKIFGKMYKLKADVVKLNAFSAHADYNEIKEWIKNYDLKKLKKVFLVHGEDDALANLKKELLSVGVKEVEISACGTDYELDV